jgi:plastocyanin
MRHRSILPALILGFLLATSASAQHHHSMTGNDYDDHSGGGDPNPAPNCEGVQAKITISGTTSSPVFSPASVTIDRGQPVCWTWSATSMQHSVKSDDGTFSSGAPANDGTFQRTFSNAGTFGYYCQVHGSPTGGMRGTVIVRGDSGGGSGGGSGPGTLAFSAPNYTVDEGAGVVTVTVERHDGSDGAASVKFSTANGTAKVNKDFSRLKGSLTWAAGDSSSKTIEVPIKNDSAQEGDETFAINLSKATGAALGTGSVIVTIHDDDTPGCGSASVTAPSQLQARGQSDGEIRLTWADDAFAASELRIERRQAGGSFQEIASVAAGVASFTDSGLPGGSTFQYRLRAVGIDGASAFSGIAAGATDGATTPCDETNALCLNGGRFEAMVERNPGAGEGRTWRLELRDAPSTGLFAFSRSSDPQVLLNVTDGCAANQHYWLSLATITDVELTVKVRDTQTGRTWVYFKPAGSVPAPIRDVEAFSSCQ